MRLPALLLACLTAGCLVVPIPRDRSSLGENDRPAGPVALLPLTAESISLSYQSSNARSAWLYEPKDLAEDCNDVLNTLAKRRDGTLFGPDDLGSEGTADERARGVGATRVVRLRAVVDVDGGGGGAWPFAPVALAWWRGTVTVRAELYDLTTDRVLATADHTAEFWGGIGNPLVVAGAAVWKTFARAADQATRAALADLRVQTEAATP